LGSARRSPSPRSPQFETDRRSRMTCGRASTPWRGLLRRPSISPDARSASCCGRSCPCRARTARPKGPRRSRSGRLVQVGEQGQVFLDHAPRELRGDVDCAITRVAGNVAIEARSKRRFICGLLRDGRALRPLSRVNAPQMALFLLARSSVSRGRDKERRLDREPTRPLAACRFARTRRSACRRAGTSSRRS
jgi:hypothetical protein